MSFRVVAGLGLAVMAVPASLSAQGAASDAERNWAAIVQCGAIEGAEARHRCTDNVLRSAGVLSTARIAQESRQEFGRERRPEPPRPAPPPQPELAQAEAPEPDEADELLTTIKAVRTVGYQKVRVTTAEGSVWEQTQARSFNSEPKVGDPFSVERAALGSYRCRFANSARYRCERMD